jgi:diadenosine tetraphosphate (Ap4A) HIT family hydrolase
MTEHCPFCALLLNPDKRVLGDYSYSIVIFSDPRLMPGHLLVIPKRHVEKITELSNEEKVEIFHLIEEYQEKILQKLASGCDIRQHYRPFMKQGRLKVNHLHFHLQPRENEDLLYDKVQRYETVIFENLASEELDRLKKILDKP